MYPERPQPRAAGVFVFNPSTTGDDNGRTTQRRAQQALVQAVPRCVAHELAGAGEDHKALRAIAQGLIRKAKKGDVTAIREVADRLDGRPPHAVEMSGGLTITHEEALEQLE